MARKKKKGKPGLPTDKDPMHVFHLDAIEATRLKKPRYNAYAIGHGPHGDTSYNRRREAASTRRLLKEEGL